MKRESFEFAMAYLTAYNSIPSAEPLRYEDYEPDEFLQAHCETIVGDITYPRSIELNLADCALAKPLFQYWKDQL